MPRAYHSQIRWLVVFKRFYLGHSPDQIAEALHVSISFQKKVIKVFLETGAVQRPHGGSRGRLVAGDMERQILHNVLDSPTLTLQQHSDMLVLSHGVRVSVPTLCRAMRRCNLSYRCLQHYALRRDEQRADAFWRMIVTFYPLHRLLVGDETSKHKGVMRRHRGWGPVGISIFDRDVVLTRSRTVSALTYFSMRGFEDWRYSSGTYDSAAWQRATDDMLLTPKPYFNNETLAEQFDALLLDNASIHKDEQYLRKVGMYIKVLFIPPYCYHLSPLDNGAYGCAYRPCSPEFSTPNHSLC